MLVTIVAFVGRGVAVGLAVAPGVGVAVGVAVAAGADAGVEAGAAVPGAAISEELVWGEDVPPPPHPTIASKPAQLSTSKLPVKPLCNMFSLCTLTHLVPTVQGLYPGPFGLRIKGSLGKHNESVLGEQAGEWKR